MAKKKHAAFVAENPDFEWFDYYARGAIVKRDDTPQKKKNIRTIEDWADQCLDSACAMYRFAKGKPTSPRVMLQEISECISECATDRERASLLEVQVWAIREAQLSEAANELRKAREAYMQASSWLDPYCMMKIATASGD